MTLGLKRRLPSDVTFVAVLRHMCRTFSVRYNYILLRHYLSKTNGYVVLKRKCYPLYMRKTT